MTEKTQPYLPIRSRISSAHITTFYKIRDNLFGNLLSVDVTRAART
jgi:hypothetical protein